MFYDAEQCLAEFSKTPADIVISDVNMPKMNGLELCRQLLEIEPDCPVLFISGKMSDEEKIAGYEAGGYDYLTKPYSLKELLAKLTKITIGVDEVEKRQSVEIEEMRSEFD